MLPSPIATRVDELRSGSRFLISLIRGELAPPPPHAKRAHLRRLIRTHDLRVFVESGTYLGGTTAFLRPHVDRVITIELEPRLAAAARERFAADAAITVIEGDALDALPPAIAQLDQAALIFLDGHFSGGETARGPLSEPAVAILNSLNTSIVPAGSIFVIDDLRQMGHSGNPALDEFAIAARASFPDASFMVGVDSLVIKT